MREDEGLVVLYGRTRYVILFLSLLCLTFYFSNSLIFNFTIICMDVCGFLIFSLNISPAWVDDSAKVNALISAISIGCLIGTLPLSFLIQTWGIGNVCSFYGIFSCLATLIIPLAVDFDFSAVFLLRILQGISTPLSYVATGQIASQWATEKDSGSFISILSAHLQFCNIFTMPISGAMCKSSWGWRGDYYLHGIVSFFIFLFFYLFYVDNPQDHKMISNREIHQIFKGKSQQTKAKIPYKLIISDPCVYAIWLSTLGGIIGSQLFILYGPLYVNKVLGMSVVSTGFATALPYILSCSCKFIIGPLSDKMTFLSQRIRFIIFAALSQGALAICLVIMSFSKSAQIAQIAYTAAIVFNGINIVGVVKCAQVVYREHVHFVMSVTAFLMCFVVFLLPVAVHLACPDNSQDQWSRLFLVIAILVALASTPFIFLAKEESIVWKNSQVFLVP